MSTHRIVVAGGGYLGLAVAQRLAGPARKRGASVTLVTARAAFDQRTRWHELAAGRPVAPLPLDGALAGSGVELRLGTIANLGIASGSRGRGKPGGRAADAAPRALLLAAGSALPYDTLVIALGSVVDLASAPVPGVAAHAVSVTDPAAVGAIAERLAALPGGAPVAVVGGGLSGIELATEIAEAHPRLAVAQVSPAEPGAWLGAKARRHLAEALDRLGVARVRGRVTRVEAGRIAVEGVGELPSALTVWAGGLRGNPVLAASGLAVDGDGRARADAGFHALDAGGVAIDGVFAGGDAAAISGPWGPSLKMGARVAMYQVAALTASVVAGLDGRPARPLAFDYQAECISLGRRDGILQFLHRDESVRAFALAGRGGAAAKRAIVAYAHAVPRHPHLALPAARPRADNTAAPRCEMITA